MEKEDQRGDGEAMKDREIVEQLREGLVAYHLNLKAADAIERLIQEFLQSIAENKRLIKERDEALEALKNCSDSMDNVPANFLESKNPTFDAADFRGSKSRARSILSKHEAKP